MCPKTAYFKEGKKNMMTTVNMLGVKYLINVEGVRVTFDITFVNNYAYKIELFGGCL